MREIHLTIDDELAEALDEHVQKRSKQLGMRVTQRDAVRVIIREALERPEGKARR